MGDRHRKAVDRKVAEGMTRPLAIIGADPVLDGWRGKTDLWGGVFGRVPDGLRNSKDE